MSLISLIVFRYIIIFKLDIIDSPTVINVNYNRVADNNLLSSDMIGSLIKINVNYRRFTDDILH